MTEPAAGGALLLLLAFGVFLYLLPALVAWARRHRQRAAIALLTLLLGWTLLGWVAALVWAATADVEPEKAS